MMHDKTDADLTLPSVAAALPGYHPQDALVLTIAFHSDTARIGEVAVLPWADGPLTLGRLGPAFGGIDGGEGRPLGEPHVSRKALQLDWRDPLLSVSRFAGSSRCRLAGRELVDGVELDREQLAAGVPVMLGHGVVLCMRRCALRPGPVDAGSGDPAIKGRSAYTSALREQIARVADSGLDVLIRGETGTGKELVARAIHRGSRRSAAPLVSVNMSAVPPGLAAAALFGSSKGAFTGSDRAGEGYFQQAEGGSLFLDEIGDTPAEVQPQLLRALQQREIQSVGGRIRRVDLRVISATDADLDGPGCDFRAALRHRLAASEIVLDPLRNHPEDIGELAWHFCRTAAAELGREACLPGSHSHAMATAAWADLFHRFLHYPWPGNVRELSNVARQVVLASGELPVIPPGLAQTVGRPQSRPLGDRTQRGIRAMREVAENEFDRAMEENCFEVAPAARQLNVSRQSLYRRIEKSPRHRLASQVPLEQIRQAHAANGGDLLAAARQLRVSPSGLRARSRNAGLAWN